jgi:hypothetical protein
MIKKLKCYFILLISTSTSSMMKAFGFQFGFDSYIFQLITSIQLDRSFCLLWDVIMYTIRQLFFHSSNTINVYNGNCYDHKQLSACVNIQQLYFIMFQRFPRLCNISYNERIYFLSFVRKVASIATALDDHIITSCCMPMSLNFDCERDITPW